MSDLNVNATMGADAIPVEEEVLDVGTNNTESSNLESPPAETGNATLVEEKETLDLAEDNSNNNMTDAANTTEVTTPNETAEEDTLVEEGEIATTNSTPNITQTIGTDEEGADIIMTPESLQGMDNETGWVNGTSGNLTEAIMEEQQQNPIQEEQAGEVSPEDLGTENATETMDETVPEPNTETQEEQQDPLQEETGIISQGEQGIDKNTTEASTSGETVSEANTENQEETADQPETPEGNQGGEEGEQGFESNVIEEQQQPSSEGEIADASATEETLENQQEELQNPEQPSEGEITDSTATEENLGGEEPRGDDVAVEEDDQVEQEEENEEKQEDWEWEGTKEKITVATVAPMESFGVNQNLDAVTPSPTPGLRNREWNEIMEDEDGNNLPYFFIVLIAGAVVMFIVRGRLRGGKSPRGGYSQLPHSNPYRR